MGEDPLPRLEKWRISLGEFGRNKKRNSLIIIILVIATSLFFSVIFRKEALAEKYVLSDKVPKLDVMDPMERIGQGFQDKLTLQNDKKQLCEISIKATENISKDSLKETGYREMVSGHPMEAMVPFISQEDDSVAAFLIGIAKKESDWGTHSPKKDGRECYNFWGYKGGYNVTEGGYSCFDSPEQAVAVVGARIQELITKNIDTPARMVVWKCGNASCEGHDPMAVKKWIVDVRTYYDKAMS